MNAVKPEWKVIPCGSAKYVGGLEFQDNKGEWHDFLVISLPRYLVFGGATNNSFLQSGYIVRDDAECLDETLAELLADLEVYYNDGPQYVSRIVCNDCM